MQQIIETYIKVCSQCLLPKGIGEYYSSGKGRLRANCNTCESDRAKARSAKQLAIVARWKRIKGCNFCGDKSLHSCQLQLDHIDRDTKSKVMKGKNAINYQWSMKRIKAELANCQVLCANCHSLKTYNERR